MKKYFFILILGILFLFMWSISAYINNTITSTVFLRETILYLLLIVLLIIIKNKRNNKLNS